MNNNTLKIILLSIIAIVLLAFMCLVIFGNSYISVFRFSNDNKLLLEEEYSIDNLNNILVDVTSSEINVIKSDDNQIKLKIYGSEKDNYDIKNKDNELRIKKEATICIGLCFYSDKIELALPEEYLNKLTIKSVSGDIDFTSTFNIDVNIKTTSGDVKAKGLNNAIIDLTSGDIEIGESKNLELTTKSGDIEIGNVYNIDASTISGSININSINIDKDCKLKTTSGDIEIKNSNDIYYEAKTVSGEIEINNNNRYANFIMNLQTTSGDITVR